MSAMPSSASHSSPPHPYASKQRVIRGILRGLMEGRWQENDRLTEASAVDEFGVSRTPVREAFLALQGLSLLELRRNCGAVLLPFGPSELADLYAVRSLLETEATRLAATRMPGEMVESLIEQFIAIRKAGETDPDWKHDRELHRGIASHSGNRRLDSEIACYGELIQTMREIVAEHLREIHSTSTEQHLAILEGLRKQDPEKAGAAMKAHLTQASESAIAAMEAMRS